MTGLAVLIIGGVASLLIAVGAVLEAPRWTRAAYTWLTRPAPGAHEQRDVPRIFPRAGPPAGDKDQRETAYATLGTDIYADHTVRLPRTPPLAPLPAWQPHTERVATDTDVRTIEPETDSTFIRALLAAVPDPDRIDAIFAGR